MLIILNRIYRILIIFILFSAESAMAATSHEIFFRRLGMHDGLSENSVNCVFKDSKGFLWAGTTLGLNRYDGYRFKKFYYCSCGVNGGVSSCLPDNNVLDIIEDAEHHLWIRTTIGYCIFDPLTETFNSDITSWLREHGMKGVVRPSLRSLGYRNVMSDKKGNLWIYVEGIGCYYYDFSNGKAMLLRQGRGHLPSGVISDIDFVGKNVLFTYDDGLLALVNPMQKKTLWVNGYIPQSGDVKNKSYRTYVDHVGNYWIFNRTRAKVLLKKTGQWKRFEYMVEDICEDRTGRVWLGTDHDGILMADNEGRLTGKLKNDRTDNRSIPDNTVQSLYLDDIGTMWVGTYKSGLAYHFEGQMMFSPIPLGDVCTMVENGNGCLWCGTNYAGIVKYNIHTGAATRIGKAQSHLGSDIVISSLRSRDGSLWFGSYRGGLTRYKNGKFTAYRHRSGGSQSLASDDVWCLLEGKDGNIYIGELGGGLQIFNPQTGKFTTYNSKNSNLLSDAVFTLCNDKNGNVMIGGVYYYSTFNIKTHKITFYKTTDKGQKFSCPITNHIYRDSRGLIWLATASGLNMYDPANGKLNNVTLPVNQGKVEVCAISEDRQGVMWITASNTLNRVSLKKNKGEWNFIITTFDELSGLQT